jgi:hypothetical protein
MSGEPRRIGVFVDYWYVYTSARQLFAQPGPPPPPWFGNVSPRALAGTVVKRPPIASRRSERILAGTHVFVRNFDPEVHRGQLDRVRRWELEEATVTVGPSREEGGGHWQSSVSVALACAVVDALARGSYDTAVVFAGDGALWPMFAAVSGGAAPSQTVELVTWVGRDGAVPTALASLPQVWCHRLGETSFKQVVDDRRPSQHQARVHPAPPGPAKPAATPRTAMAAALAAAGLGPGGRQPGEGGGQPPSAAPPSAPAPPAAPADIAEGPPPPSPAPEPGGVRRLAHRLFGRGD